MTLHMIGLGLADEKDVTVKGLETIKKCDYLYLEHYTSILPGKDISTLEEFYGKNLIIAGRDLVEQNADEILNKAIDFEVGFLVVGDVFSATTHTDLFLRAKNKKIIVNIINNASVINAIGNTGLELYRFGITTSMVFFEEGWMPKNAYNAIVENQKIGLHTLVLLDIKVAEASPEHLKREIDIKLPPRFMSVNQALEQLLFLESQEKKGIISKETKVLGVARLGCEDQIIRYGSVKSLIKHKFGDPLHCLIIPGKLHHVEKEVLSLWEK